ncbi:MAG: VanZ family protein [Micrococcales bacterium]
MNREREALKQAATTLLLNDDAGGAMAQFETIAAYFGRLVTFQDLLWIAFLWSIGFLIRKPVSKRLAVSVKRYLLIALAFAGVIGLSLRFWVATGTLNTFWLVDPEVWAAGFHLNANFLLNICLYVPPALLLVLAGKGWLSSWLMLLAMSFTIETIQHYARIGQGDPMDFFANGIGALVGLGLGLIVARVLPKLAV